MNFYASISTITDCQKNTKYMVMGKGNESAINRTKHAVRCHVTGADRGHVVARHEEGPPKGPSVVSRGPPGP